MTAAVALRNSISKPLSDGPVLSIMVHEQLGGGVMGVSPIGHI